MAPKAIVASGKKVDRRLDRSLTTAWAECALWHYHRAADGLAVESSQHSIWLGVHDGIARR